MNCWCKDFTTRRQFLGGYLKRMSGSWTRDLEASFYPSSLCVMNWWNKLIMLSFTIPVVILWRFWRLCFLKTLSDQKLIRAVTSHPISFFSNSHYLLGHVLVKLGLKRRTFSPRNQLMYFCLCRFLVGFVVNKRNHEGLLLLIYNRSFILWSCFGGIN